MLLRRHIHWQIINPVLSRRTLTPFLRSRRSFSNSRSTGSQKNTGLYRDRCVVRLNNPRILSQILDQVDQAAALRRRRSPIAPNARAAKPALEGSGTAEPTVIPKGSGKDAPSLKSRNWPPVNKSSSPGLSLIHI